MVASTSLFPNGALLKLFPTVSSPSTLLTLPSGSFPTELSTSGCSRPKQKRKQGKKESKDVADIETLFPCMSHCPAFGIHFTSLIIGAHFFGTIAFMEFVLKTRCQRSLPMQLSPSYFHVLDTQFSGHRIDWNCPEKPPSQPTLVRRFHLARRSPALHFPQFPRRPPCRRFRLAPSQRSSPMQAISHGFPSVHHACPMDPGLETLTKVLGAQFFCAIGLVPFVLKNPCQQVCSYSLAPRQYRFLPTELSPSYFPWFPSVHPLLASVSLLPLGALLKLFPTITVPKLFPTVSLPSTLSSLPYRCFPGALPSYFPRFPFRPPFRCFRIAPSQRSSPHAIFPMVSRPSTHSSLPYRSFPPNSPSYCPQFPVRPPSRCFRIVPSQRSSPQAISHGFPSVHPLVASVSLLPRSSPQLFPTVSFPSTVSLLPYRSFPTELSPCYISHGFPSVHPLVASVSLLPTTALPMLFPTVSPRPPSRHSRIAPSDRTLPKLFPTVSLPSTLRSFTYRSPSHRSSPQAISYFFPSVHPLVASVSLLPLGPLPKLFRMVSLPSTLSSLPYRSSRVHPLVASVSLLPLGALSLPSTLSSLPRFPFRPPCRHSRIAPFHRSSPHAISHGFLSVHPLVASVSLPRGKCN